MGKEEYKYKKLVIFLRKDLHQRIKTSANLKLIINTFQDEFEKFLTRASSEKGRKEIVRKQIMEMQGSEKTFKNNSNYKELFLVLSKNDRLKSTPFHSKFFPKLSRLSVKDRTTIIEKFLLETFPELNNNGNGKGKIEKNLQENTKQSVEKESNASKIPPPQENLNKNEANHEELYDEDEFTVH